MLRKTGLLTFLACLLLASQVCATMVQQDWNTGVAGSRQAIIDFLVDLVNPVPIPDEEKIIEESRLPNESGKDNYVAKFYGWVTVPESGDYQFHYSSDDYGMLYVSQDEEMENAVEVAWVDGWAAPAEWDKYPTQHSEVMSLKKGQEMAVMAFFQEAGGGDNMDIGWTGPGLSQDIANPTYLTDYITHIAPIPTKAKKPSPEDGTTDVDRDTMINWTPGKYAAKHNVYLSTDFADVNDAAAGALLAENLDVNSVDPGRLDFGATYYLRVDEVNSAPDFTVYAGKTWSFEVEPYSYPITGITATASSSHADDMGPENTINGVGLNELDQHSTEPTEMWLSGMGDAERSITYEFDKVYKLDELRVWNSNQPVETFLGLGAKDVTVEYSTDGATWTTLENVPPFAQATATPDYEANTTVEFDGAVAKFVKLTIDTGYGILPQYGLSAVRFYYVPVSAREPQPADGVTTENANVVLSWRSGRESASSEVYLGTDAADMALLGTTTENSMAATGVEYGTTYFWSVTEVNEAEAVTSYAGDTWSFVVPAAGIVDDFEQYDDKCYRVFFNWEDGLGHNGGEDIENCDVPAFNGNGTGSILGNATAPFAEQAVVHTDRQSLPYSYDGNSEATVNTADLAIGQDWTKGAATTLVIWVRGELTNAPADQLYAKIDNTRVDYEGDLTVPIWQQWNIDLAASGTNLSSVNSLTIGVDATGQGMLYVDDIALYREAPAIVGPAPGDDPSLVGHWKLDETEGLVAADSSGYGNHGTLIGFEGNAWTAGMVGGALEFAGAQIVDLGSNSSLQLFDSATISAWAKMNEGSDGVYMGIAGKLVTGYYQGFALVRHGSNVFRLWCDDGAGVLGGHDASSDDTYTDTEWHHLVGVIDDGTSTLYVDGVAQTTQGSVDLTDSGTIAHIGRQYSVPGVNRFWQGLIDDVKIWYRALSAAEVTGM